MLWNTRVLHAWILLCHFMVSKQNYVHYLLYCTRLIYMTLLSAHDPLASGRIEPFFFLLAHTISVVAAQAQGHGCTLALLHARHKVRNGCNCEY